MLSGREIRRWIGAGIGALAAAALLAPGSALGATVAVDGDRLNFSAGSGEINDVTVERISANHFQVRENRAPLTAGSGCNQQGEHQARCAAAGVTLIDVRTGNLDDRAEIVGSTPAEIRGGSGSDTLFGGGGNDNLFAGAVQTSSFGSETLVGGAGNDRLTGSTSESSFTQLQGDAGNDLFFGGPGSDSAEGGPGADDIRGGGGSNDTASYFSSLVGVTVTINDVANDGAAGEGDNVRTDVENVNGTNFHDDITGSAGPDSLFGGFAGNDVVRGAGGNDFVGAADGNDQLRGGSGNDRLQGGLGADDIVGGPDIDEAEYGDRFNPATQLTITLNDVANDGEAGEGDNVRTDVENVSGGSGNDSITGNGQRNRLIGTSGNDTLRGAGGNDLLAGDFEFGGTGDDDLLGGPGDDELIGGLGNDTVNGGTGSDRVLGDLTFAGGGGGNDTVVGGNGEDLLDGGVGADKLNGAGGVDAATYQQRSEPLEITIDDVANDGAAGEGDNVRITVEIVVGGSGNDTLTGSGANEVLFGGPGSDTVRGEGGDDLIDGETPNVFGSFGGDVLVGGTGTDTASYVSHGFNSLDVTIDNVANDGTPGEGDNVRVNVENLIGASSGDSLTGSAGANAIAGGSGNDTLFGLEGPDFLAGESGGDTHEGGPANDRINSRGDFFVDTDNCGAGSNDSVTADSFDTVNPDCENVFNSAPLALDAGAAAEGDDDDRAAVGEPSLAEAKRLLRLARALIE